VTRLYSHICLKQNIRVRLDADTAQNDILVIQLSCFISVGNDGESGWNLLFHLISPIFFLYIPGKIDCIRLLKWLSNISHEEMQSCVGMCGEIVMGFAAQLQLTVIARKVF
jgi:hypothetical protein